MTPKRTVLILGATGGIGGAITASLIDHGWNVRALVRDPVKASLEWIRNSLEPVWVEGDAMNGPDVIAAAGDVGAIVHAVNPPGYRNWDRVVLPMMENTIAAARAAGGARIVLPGTIYNFDPARVSVIDANSDQIPKTRKGAIRVKLERLLEDIAPEIPSLIVRAGDFFGPGSRASWFAQAMVKPGQPVRRIANLASGAGHSWAYLPDLAEAIVRLMNLEDGLNAFERVQFEGYCDLSGTGMVTAIRNIVGTEVPERHFPWWLMRLLAPFGGFPREAVEIEPYWRHPMRLDNRRLISLIGEEPRTPLDISVSQTLCALGCIDCSTERLAA